MILWGMMVVMFNLNDPTHHRYLVKAAFPTQKSCLDGAAQTVYFMKQASYSITNYKCERMYNEAH